MTEKKGTISGTLAVDRQHPYLGLQSFSENDREFFFGRMREHEELFRLVRRGVLTVLFGVSGLGKTSLLQAGLSPKLRQANYLPISIRLLFGPQAPDPVSQLKAKISDAIEKHCIDTDSPEPEQTLWEYFHRTRFWNRRNHLLTPVLVFDQFEEIFTIGESSDGSGAFLQEISDLVENNIPLSVRARLVESGAGQLPYDYDKPTIKVVFSLREDYLAQLEDLRPLIPSLAYNRFRLTHMHDKQAMEAVIKPGGHLVEESVAERIVRFVAGTSLNRNGTGEPVDSTGKLVVEPALLSLVCYELNERRLEQHLEQITLELLESTQSKILADFYLRSVSDLSPSARAFIEDNLITASGYRSTKAVEDALQVDGVNEEVLNKLFSRRLLRKEERLGIPHVELIHDVLTGIVQDSRQQRKEKEKEEEERLIRSRLHRQRTIFVLASLVFLTLAVLSGFQWRRASKALIEVSKQRNVARARQLASQAEFILTNQPLALSRSALLATESLIHAQTPTGTRIAAAALTILPDQTAKIVHQDTVRDAAFSPQGTELLTACDDGMARLWEASSGKELHRFSHEDAIRAVGFSPDGKKIATAADDNTARLWDAENGNEVRRFIHEDRVYSLKLSRDGKRLATTGRGNSAWIWDTETGQLLARLDHKDRVYSANFSPDGKKTITASNDGNATIWATETGDRLLRLTHDGPVKTAAFNPQGNLAASASWDNSVRVWDAGKGRELFRLQHDGPVNAMSFSPNGMVIGTASFDKTARLWNVETGRQLRQLSHSRDVQAIRFSPDSSMVLTVSEDKTANLWDVSSGKKLSQLSHEDYIYKAIFSPDGLRVATASGDRTAGIWNISSQDGLVRMIHNGSVRSIIYNAYGNRLATASWDKHARIWDAATGKLILQRKVDGEINDIRFSPNGDNLAAATGSSVRLWNSQNGRQLAQVTHDRDVLAVSFSPDNSRLATASDDKTARLWALPEGSNEYTLHHDDSVRFVTFNHSGSSLATASWDRTARIWDAKDGRQLAVLRHEDSVFTVAFSPDDKLLLTAGDDRIVRLWNIEEQREILSLPHTEPVNAIAFSGNGELIVTAGDDQTARLWQTRSGKEMLRLAHEGSIFAIAFSADNQFIATAGGDKTARIWSTTTGRELARFDHDNSVYTVSFSPNGRQIATASETIGWVWPWYAEDLISAACNKLSRNLTRAEWLNSLEEESYRKTCKNLPIQ